jgi:hypothetical protein
MLKKILIGLGIFLSLLAIGGYVVRDTLLFFLAVSAIAPEEDFELANAPAAPDYVQAAAWAALPGKADPSDDRPDGLDASGDTSRVGVFFVHPTTYVSKANWNQPLDDAAANWAVDERVLRHQASVFNSCCEVFAPRYRQATFYSFMDFTSDNGEQALELAYSDVLQAFDAFISQWNGDRPFILAGHSQGTFHAARLLRERIAGTPLAEKMVAAYLIGYSITPDQTGGIPVCESATDAGCVVGWNANDAGESGLYPNDDLICVNPLSWRADDALASNELNKGGIGFPDFMKAAEGEDFEAMPVEVAVADAQCVGGTLAVADLRSGAFPSRMPGGSMHVYDYSLFHMNVRENATIRVEAFLSTH